MTLLIGNIIGFLSKAPYNIVIKKTMPLTVTIYQCFLISHINDLYRNRLQISLNFYASKRFHWLTSGSDGLPKQLFSQFIKRYLETVPKDLSLKMSITSFYPMPIHTYISAFDMSTWHICMYENIRIYITISIRREQK